MQQIEEMEEESGGLKKTLGLVQGCTIIVGSIIGSGIFICEYQHFHLNHIYPFLDTFLPPAPGGVLKNTGSINMSLMVCNISFFFIQRISQSNKFKSQFLKVWILSGLFSMVGAYCYAELGLLIRKVSKMTICTTCTLLI